MANYTDKYEVNLTSYLEQQKNGTIKNILTVLDVSALHPDVKEKLRSAILSNINGFHRDYLRVLCYIQEQKNGDDCKN